MGDEALLIKLSETIASVPFEVLTSSQRTFKAIWELEAEVNNGGFSQYFFNSPGRKAEQAREALIEIGAVRCAKLVARALTAVGFEGIEWASDLAWQDRIVELEEHVEDALSEIDDEFFQYPDNLSDLLTAFVASHPGDFDV